MRRPIALLSVSALTAMLACSESTGVLIEGNSHIRIVNSLYRGVAATATAQNIDFLIDSLNTSPSQINLGANQISAGDSANRYTTISAVVHSYVAKTAGDSTTNGTVYSAVGGVAMLPRQYLAPQTYYTVIIAGIAPATPPVAFNTIPFVALVDDPFPGPRVGGVLQARFKVVNAAPYSASSGAGATVSVYLTPGSTPPTGAITLQAPLGTATYRNFSNGFNVDPGTYVISVAVGSTVLAQQVVTFAAGEVRTFVLQSTRAGAPSATNHVLTNILDHSYPN